MSFFENFKKASKFVAESAKDTASEFKETYHRLDGKSSKQLQDIIDSEGFFGATSTEKLIAKQILAKRQRENSDY